MSINLMDTCSPTVQKTKYDNASCDVGVIHLGYGAFHRAHQSVYFDDYMETTGDMRWGVAAVNLRESESGSFKEISDTAGYMLKTIAPNGTESFRLVRSHCRFVDWSSAADEAENLASLPSVHIISITVTESGYYLNDDMTLNLNDALISSEIAGGKSCSIYAYLLRALKGRANTIDQPINILCCDNIRANGKMLSRNFKAYLKACGETDLLAWVDENVSFPCSMVDKITPRATDELKAEIKSLFPGQSLNPIHAEEFSQWVLEDKFTAPMPALNKVGVEIVEDVDPFEETKIRILNGGHTALCYLGALAGLNTFDEIMDRADLLQFYYDFEIREVLPGLDLEVPFDKNVYVETVAKRFSNAALADQLERICMDGFSKMTIYVRPTIDSCLKQGITPHKSFASIASWYVYAKRFSSGKVHIIYHEPLWGQLKPLLEVGAEEEFATTKQLWGDIPDRYDEFVPGVLSAIKQMEQSWPA